VLLNDGLIELKVLQKVDNENLECEIIYGGELKDGKGVNFPDSDLKGVPPLTEKDVSDLNHGLSCGVDLVALSFVRSAQDILTLKEHLVKDSCIKVIAKIEKPQALDDLDNIFEVVDGIMLARGDLGVEVPYENLPALQKKIIQKANDNNVLVITATQMLESMVHSARPTRAEVSDVANAIFDGTDAIMLSGETASGKYPVLVVQTMHKIALQAEAVAPLYRHQAKTMQENLAKSACELAERVGASAIASFTLSGKTAKLISKQRPPVKVVALTQKEIVSRQLSLCWGITPLLLVDVHDTETMMKLVEKTLIEHGLVKIGDIVVVTGGLPIAARGESNFIKIHKCEGNF
jgi:pyruvate kinase